MPKDNEGGPILISAPSSLNDPVSCAQRDFFVSLVSALDEKFQRSGGSMFSSQPEYERLIEGAYACGFVCGDIDPDLSGEIYEKHLSNIDKISKTDLASIKYIVHFIMRAERHSDAGSDIGGGVIFEAIEAGLLKAIVKRLMEMQPADM